jgi:hypothetical protein
LICGYKTHPPGNAEAIGNLLKALSTAVDSASTVNEIKHKTMIEIILFKRDNLKIWKTAAAWTDYYLTGY